MSDLWDRIKNGDVITPNDIENDNHDDGLVMVNESLDLSDDGLESIYYTVDDEKDKKF